VPYPARAPHGRAEAYILADNKLAEKAGWDLEILKIELQHLTSLDLDFDISVIDGRASDRPIVPARRRSDRAVGSDVFLGSQASLGIAQLG